MNFFPPYFFASLLDIVVIDLVLSGDNAIIIAMAARRLPSSLQLRAIAWGTLGAIVVRIIMTAAVVYLLNIPGLMLVGGVVLLPIAWNLLRQDDSELRNVSEAVSFWAAIRTIIVADVLMGLDNVLGVAGASQGYVGLVLIGLLLSVPLVVWGSTLILKLVARFPLIIYVGAAAIAWSAAGMITNERLIQPWIDAHEWTTYALDAVCIGGVCGAGWWSRRRDRLSS